MDWGTRVLKKLVTVSLALYIWAIKESQHLVHASKSNNIVRMFSLRVGVSNDYLMFIAFRMLSLSSRFEITN